MKLGNYTRSLSAIRRRENKARQLLEEAENIHWLAAECLNHLNGLAKSKMRSRKQEIYILKTRLLQEWDYQQFVAKVLELDEDKLLEVYVVIANTQYIWHQPAYLLSGYEFNEKPYRLSGRESRPHMAPLDPEIMLEILYQYLEMHNHVIRRKEFISWTDAIEKELRRFQRRVYFWRWEHA